mmetsp:Transcript_23010/g.46494  ORF Transcript_23010/g.46494 Transcript_23010/m.46494 type:complete len:208 (-) Transcript_23010:192-815(-)
MNGIKYIPVQLKSGSALPAGAIPFSPTPQLAAPAAPVKAAPKPVVKAAPKPHLPYKSRVVAGGNYGHLAEAILTTHKGPVKVEKGNVLRSAAPPVSRLAAPTRSSAEAKMLALQFKDAMHDCNTDASDDCQNLLHLHGKHLRAFEHDQEKADSGLFNIFESAQRIPDANGQLPGMVHGGMLAQLPGHHAAVDSFGIPYKGSLPGDNV